MRYTKKVGIVLFVLLFFILGLTAQGNNENNVEIIVKAFKDTGASLDAYWLHIGTPYGAYTDDQSLLSKGNELSKSFMLDEERELALIGNQKVYMNKGTWGNETEVELTLRRPDDQSKDLYLIFRLKGNQEIAELGNYYNLLEKILKDNQVSPKINSCIQGNINGKLSNTEQFAQINSILRGLDAEKVESLDTELVKSVSAYSDKISYFIWTGSKKMNVQVSTHVDQLNQKTVLTLGTPIITIEY